MKEYKLIILSIIAATVVIGGAIWFSKQNTPSDNLPAVNATLSAEQTSFDFGTVSMANGNVSAKFKIKNSGPEPLTITKIYTSCMCTAATLVKNDGKRFGPVGMLGHGYVPSIKESLAVSEEAEIEVIFDPTAHGPAGIGKIERAVTLENNTNTPLVLTISANVTP
ncbi:MAG: DUF1573 domain-containing protein [Patescibacteria group bacterium]